MEHQGNDTETEIPTPLNKDLTDAAAARAVPSSSPLFKNAALADESGLGTKLEARLSAIDGQLSGLNGSRPTSAARGAHGARGASTPATSSSTGRALNTRNPFLFCIEKLSDDGTAIGKNSFHGTTSSSSSGTRAKSPSPLHFSLSCDVIVADGPENGKGNAAVEADVLSNSEPEQLPPATGQPPTSSRASDKWKTREWMQAKSNFFDVQQYRTSTSDSGNNTADSLPMSSLLAAHPTLLQTEVPRPTKDAFATKKASGETKHKEAEEGPRYSQQEETPAALLAGFYRYCALFTLVPLALALLCTCLRGVAPVCVFDGEALGAHLHQSEHGEVRPPAGQPSRGEPVFDAERETNQARKLGVPVDPVWGVVAQPGVLSAVFLAPGTGWLITNISAGLFVVDPRMETNSVASWMFLSFVLCVFLPYVAFLFFANFVPLQNKNPDGTKQLRLSFFAVLAALTIWWALLMRVYAFRRFPKRVRRIRSPCRISKAVVAFFFMGMVGLGVGIQYVFVFLPAAQEVFAEWGAAPRIAGELALSMCYFGFWLPLVEKLAGAVWLPLMAPRKQDFHPVRPVQVVADSEPALSQVVATASTSRAVSREEAPGDVECDFYTETKNIRSSLRRREGALFLILYMASDIIRFSFGRGILLQLSYSSCALVMFADIVHHAWHYAMRHHEAHLFFQPGRVIGTAPYGFRFHYPKTWKRLFQAFSWLQAFIEEPLPRSLAQAFVRKYEYDDFDGTEENEEKDEDEPCQTVAFQFANVRLELEKVPSKVLRELFLQSETATGHREAEDPSSPNTRSCIPNAEISHGPKTLDNGSCGEEPEGLQFSAPCVFTTSKHKEALDPVLDVPSLAKVSTARRASQSWGGRKITASYTERISRILPDGPEERARFRGIESFVRFFRKEHFVRYQVRAQTRILISLVMILVPVVCSTTNVSYYAPYPRGQSIGALLLPGLIFFVKDVVEWYLITWKCMLRNDRCVAELLPALFEAICCESTGLTYDYLRRDGMAQLVIIGSIAGLTYACDLVYSLRWTPFELSEIQTITGFRDVQWAEIYSFCESAEQVDVK